MYRSEQIKNAFNKLIGWKQNIADPVEVAKSLTTSETGLHYQSFHPLLTLRNLKAIAPLGADVLRAPWGALTNYSYNDKVSLNGVNYNALTVSTGSNPETNPNDWEVFDNFSEWLRTKTDDAILKALRNVWMEKNPTYKATNVLSAASLFNGSGNIFNVVNDNSHLVGFELIVARSRGIALNINQIGLQFKGAETVKLYVFHSSQFEPVHVLNLTRTKPNSMEWFEVDLNLQYIAGGSWYIVYNQAEVAIGTEAININRNWDKLPCCDFAEQATWSKLKNYLRVKPFAAKVNFTEQLWDISQNNYTGQNNYGLNMRVTLVCDPTDVLIEQKEAFQNILGLQVATELLREMAYNPEYNITRTQQNLTRGEILYEIDGDSTGHKKSGLKHDLDRAVKQLSLDLNNLNPVCFPCTKKGVRYKAIG